MELWTWLVDGGDIGDNNSFHSFETKRVFRTRDASIDMLVGD